MQCFIKGSTEELSLFFSSLFPVFSYTGANSSFLQGEAGRVSVCVGVHAFGTPVGVSQGVLVLCSVCFFRYVSARGNVCLRSFACLCVCVCVCLCMRICLLCSFQCCYTACVLPRTLLTVTQPSILFLLPAQM